MNPTNCVRGIGRGGRESGTDGGKLISSPGHRARFFALAESRHHARGGFDTCDEDDGWFQKRKAVIGHRQILDRRLSATHVCVHGSSCTLWRLLERHGLGQAGRREEMASGIGRGRNGEEGMKEGCVADVLDGERLVDLTGCVADAYQEWNGMEWNTKGILQKKKSV